ncbi:hypothetical protein SAMN05421670_2007 [Psychrobacillus psychrotolerans]|uniref:Cytochrome C and Quinol oxidase polypeptide I n=1 Tax=Psychrobacillus psychrotolerans TaxID=126156 RepID=A0A1I5YBB9_9BACI|nr:hypothetical protein [Psychrobacillus psychrotolerans]SFQ41197.1 hypothetical protein SAMN05421670_2007 [Psychrobacillus psychrotolerans]
MQKRWGIRLVRAGALFGLLGAYLGSHMAGAGSYALRPIHAHILLVGWLSLFVYGLFYKLYKVKFPKLVAFHGWSAIIGAIGLTAGMYLQFIQPFNINETFALVAYIIGGSTLLLSFAVFVLVTFTIEIE